MTYRGKITLLLPDGEIEATGSLTKSTVGGRESWQGTATIDPSVLSRVRKGDRVRVRLTDGAEADALVQDLRGEVTQTRQAFALEIAGEGHPPF